jgi:uncharacterized protein Yka (UPF0111/DUF47 family)
MPCRGNGADILRLFDDADDVVVAVAVAAIRAGVGVGDVVAHRAVRHAFLDLAQRVGQAIGLLARGLEDVKRETLGAFGTYPGEVLEFFDEAQKRIG